MEIFVAFYAAILALGLVAGFVFLMSWITDIKPNRIKRETEARKEVVLKLCYDTGFQLGKTGDCKKDRIADEEFYPYTQNAFLRGYFDGKDSREQAK